ncbi:hypothetical protein OOK44_35570 [Streptomyces cellulosae]|uniref:PE-PGRS family protein n=1 Tax=Streptomyces althioticus TaxID=83380 RepID=A0ABZ1YJL0_9ACTN|nr:hypothetical protein [Streptomyces cellulosae]WTB93322.1 hypothetical protein OIE99_34320 [Streptomyces cellulosae]WTC60714.1 hypothetical protein OH715_36075 [Streptomyces cellulosae]
MRTGEIQVGETYMVCVPQRLPRRVRDRTPATCEEFTAGLRLNLYRGNRFDLTVTAVDRADRTVDGYETATTSSVRLPLTLEQAITLGLPDITGHYEIEGTLHDAETNTAVELPTSCSYTAIPTRWLLPLGTPTVLSDWSIAFYRYHVRKDATGMTLPEVSAAAEESQAKERDLAGRALDNYQAEECLRSAEVEHREWRRIEAVMRQTAMTTYSPEDDPELSEADIEQPRL